MSHDNKYKYAYIAIIPASSKLGYQRRRTDGGSEYVFWIKVGDTARERPELRTRDYSINPDYHIIPIRFKETVDEMKDGIKAQMTRHNGRVVQPGKMLENMHLSCYECGGLGQAKSSEWHAICAPTIEKALELRQLLYEIVNNLKPDGGAHYSFEAVSQELEKLTKLCPPPKEKQADPINMSIPLVSIIVSPPVDQASYISLEPEVARYFICFDTWHTPRIATGYQMARNEYMTEMPYFSYNTVQLEKIIGASNKVVEVDLELVFGFSRRLLNILLCLADHGILDPTLEQFQPYLESYGAGKINYLEKHENGWYYIDIRTNASAERMRLALKDFVDNFHNILVNYLPWMSPTLI